MSRVSATLKGGRPFGRFEVISDFIVVGSSRGLGAALVEELLKVTSCSVYGISRTPFNETAYFYAWSATGRYRHIQADISSESSVSLMEDVLLKCGKKICVIYNAAHIEKDYASGDRLDSVAFDRVNSVGIQGLRNVLAVFEGHLATNGGILVGVSSFWGRLTPVSLPYVAYPATKAYLDSVFESLRYLWPAAARVVTVTIGNIKEDSGRLPSWFIPTYESAARSIVRKLISERDKDMIEYPFWHAVVYKYILRMLPRGLRQLVFNLYLKLESKAKARDMKGSL